MAAWAPADRILVETDAPLPGARALPGQAQRARLTCGTRRGLAVLRGISSPKLAELTTRNLEALCGWAPSS